MSALKTDEHSLRIFARHEAGHAVAAMVEARGFGLQNVVTLLKLDKAGDGKLASSRGVFFEYRALCDLSDEWIKPIRRTAEWSRETHGVMPRAEAHLTILLAGPYADIVGSSKADQSPNVANMFACGFWGDLEEANKLSRAMAQLPGSAFRRPWLKIHEDARSLVIDYWPVIESIATRLLRQGEMSGTEVSEVFEFFHPSEDVELAA